MLWAVDDGISCCGGFVTGNFALAGENDLGG